MKRKRFSVEQIVAIVKQAEMGMPVVELIRRHRIVPVPANDRIDVAKSPSRK